jgi:CheY-like chemotaxis protein
MPQGGTLTLETNNVTLDQKEARQFIDLTAGNYVSLIVSDQGEGMTDEVKSRIFEPFFTTKEHREGTGLGLATCYGIVKQHNGYITVDSQPQHGTTFMIYLPQAILEEDDVSPATVEFDQLQSLQGTETILLAEDETAVRVLVANILTDLGYTLIEAVNGREALQMVEEYAGTIDLLLTDMVMPQMGGKELAEHLQHSHPEMKMIFMSGYTEERIVLPDNAHTSIQKPFTPRKLAQIVRKVLDQDVSNG